MILPAHYSANWSSYTPLSLVTFPPKCIFFNSESSSSGFTHPNTLIFFVCLRECILSPPPFHPEYSGRKNLPLFSGWQQLHCQSYAIAQMFNVPWSLTLPLSPSLQMVSVANGWTEPPVCDSATKQSGWPGKKNNSTKLQSDCLPKNQKDQFLTKYAQTNHSNF